MPSPTERAVKRLKALKDKRVVVFLGAGASKTFDYPLTSEILPQIVDWLDDDAFLADLDHDKPSVGAANRQLLESRLLQLLPGESMSRRNLPLVTGLLSLLDYSLATGQSLSAGNCMEDTRQVRQLIERAILEVIGDDEPFDNASEKQLERFARVLTDLRTSAQKHPLSLITTNYDMAVDAVAFRCAGVAADDDGDWDEESIGDTVDFGFEWLRPQEEEPTIVPRPRAPRVAVLKLHGSTNWLKCPLCDNIFINPHGSIWHQAYRARLDVHNACHCSDTQLQAQIVSPSFVREMREPNLLSVWKCSLDALRSADEWLIIGYSFPDEDLGVRAMFTRAYGSRDDRPHITVIQRDESAFNRYDAFFDSNALTYCTGGLSAFVDAWMKAR